MKKKLLLGSIVLALCCFTFAACNNNDGISDGSDDSTAYVYCSQYYDVSFGNYGTFSIVPLDDSELEKSFDLSKITLSGAFNGMSITAATLSDDEYSATFSLSGSLVEGDYGIVSGEGIVKGKSVEITVPITQVYANSESKVYGNAGEQTVEIDLVSACFNKELTPADFTLSGAAKDMTVKSVSTDYVTDTDGEIILSQTATLTLIGEPDGTDYAYIDVSSNATTYNKTLRTVLETDYYGAVILNDSIDSYTLSDTVYIKANNVTFSETIAKDDLTFAGALKDYAVIEELDFVDESMIGLRLSFPYTFIDFNDAIGYISFGAESNAEGKTFSCSAYLSSPEMDYTITVNNTTATLIITLANEEFNLIASPTVTTEDGVVIFVSGVDIIDMDNYLSITFNLPENYSGMLYLEIEDAYDIKKSDGTYENVSIKTAFYI
ncbi:MAG: hypothetical protein ACI4VK_01250 [Candidatus Coproplasma sp.]